MDRSRETLTLTDCNRAAVFRQNSERRRKWKWARWMSVWKSTTKKSTRVEVRTATRSTSEPADLSFEQVLLNTVNDNSVIAHGW